jgi:hypothetical protein
MMRCTRYVNEPSPMQLQKSLKYYSCIYVTDT